MVQRAGAWDNPAHVELLKELWSTGLSAAQVAKQINATFRDAGYTRAAIIGKAHRLGLAGKGSGVRQKAPAPSRVEKAEPAKHRPAPVLKLAGRGTVFEQAEARPPRVCAEELSEPAGSVTVLTICRGQCKWPIGDPQAASFTLCGRRAPDGPYCLEHRARAYQPLAAGRPRTGNELARALRRYV